MFHLSNSTATNLHSSPLYWRIALCNWRSTRDLATTRQATNVAVDPDPPLPRFLRRQLLRKVVNGKESFSSELASQKRAVDHSSPKTFRSKHYDPTSEATPKSRIRPLEPHVLSARLKKLCDTGKIDDAIFMLKNAPLDAQNTQVWNTMIWETLKIKRYSLAYQLYIDVCPVLVHHLLVTDSVVR